MNKLLNKYLCLLLVFLVSVGITARAEDMITVSDATEFSLDEIGTLNSQSGGLPSDIWHNGNRHFIETLFATLSTDIPSPAGQDLLKRLLLTSAVPPLADSETALPLLDIRLKLLAQMGKSDDIGRLIALVPAERQTEALQTIYVASLFADNKYDDACAQTDAALARYKDIFWRKASIICKAAQKKTSEVDLAMILLAEDGQKIPDDFTKAVHEISLGKDEGKQAWIASLKQDVLALPLMQYPFPDLKKINDSVFPSKDIQAWFTANRKLPMAEQLLRASKLYANIEALGVTVTADEWRQFIAAAITNNAPMPSFVLSRLLETPVEGQGEGEAVLLILHALKGKDVRNIPAYLLTNMLSRLRNMGLEDEARDLAAEGLNEDAQPATTGAAGGEL